MSAASRKNAWLVEGDRFVAFIEEPEALGLAIEAGLRAKVLGLNAARIFNIAAAQA